MLPSRRRARNPSSATKEPRYALPRRLRRLSWQFETLAGSRTLPASAGAGALRAKSSKKTVSMAAISRAVPSSGFVEGRLTTSSAECCSGVVTSSGISSFDSVTSASDMSVISVEVASADEVVSEAVALVVLAADGMSVEIMLDSTSVVDLLVPSVAVSAGGSGLVILVSMVVGELWPGTESQGI